MKGPVHTVFSTQTIRMEKRKRVPATTGVGFTSIHDGWEYVNYEVVMDLVGMQAMAQKAARNKSGQSSMGPLRVRVLSRKDL